MIFLLSVMVHGTDKCRRPAILPRQRGHRLHRNLIRERSADQEHAATPCLGDLQRLAFFPRRVRPKMFATHSTRTPTLAGSGTSALSDRGFACPSPRFASTTV